MCPSHGEKRTGVTGGTGRGGGSLSGAWVGWGVLTWNVWEHLEDRPMIWYVVNNHGDCMSPKDRLHLMTDGYVVNITMVFGLLSLN